MSKFRKVTILMFAAVAFSFATIGCKSKGEGEVSDHPKGEHPTKAEHPKGEHPKGEHPQGEHPK